MQALKRAPGEGSVLMAASFAVPVLNPIVYKLKDQTSGGDYAPIAKLARFEFALAVAADHPAKDLDSLIAWLRIRQDPKHALFGSAALGNLPHLLDLQFGSAIGTPMTPVGYKCRFPFNVSLLLFQLTLMRLSLCHQLVPTFRHASASTGTCSGSVAVSRSGQI